MHLLQTLATQGEERLAALEQRHSLATLVSAVDACPPGFVGSAIKCYQNVIRGNTWYFPTLNDVGVMAFLVRWGQVHAAYFELAAEIFELLVKGESHRGLATSSLLQRVIQSETMRGWVGKRSSSGLDALLEARVTQLETLLAPLGEDITDEVLSLGGVYIGNPAFVTAEHESIQLFAAYHQQVGRELTPDMLDTLDKTGRALLRNFCRYSLDSFNTKYRALRGPWARGSQVDRSAAEADTRVEEWLTRLDGNECQRARQLLDEVKVLNHLNLSLEVKYSFKGWAGLMHILVIAACSEATQIDNDVYAMLNELKKMGI